MDLTLTVETSDIGGSQVDLPRREMQILTLQGTARQEHLHCSLHVCGILAGWKSIKRKEEHNKEET